MASESTETRTVSFSLPATLDDWLTERAEALGVDREELVVELVAAYQVAADLADEESAAELEAKLEDGDAIDERLDRRFDAFEDALESKLDDIRRRVVQVKRESDRKAPADHSHEALDRVDATTNRLDSLSDAVEDLRDRVETLDGTASVGEGSTGPESRPPPPRLDDVERKLTRLARAVVSLQNRLDEIETKDADGDADAVDGADGTVSDAVAVDDGDASIAVPVDGGLRERLRSLKRTAAREAIDAAECGDCGESVDLALLGEPACPHCGTAFGSLDTEPGSDEESGVPRLVGPGAGEDDDE